jgi:hypothetical protein
VALQRKLAADARPRIVYHYSVEGKGHFPLDMLRYDGCWPTHSDDVAAIGSSFLRDRRVPETAPFQVSLTGYRPPTEARWRSFGWTLVAKEGS